MNDFYDSTTNAAGGSITRVPSGGGTLGYTAASGGYYAEITNTHDAYQVGSGQSTYTRFGGNAAYSRPFYESVDYYVDLSRWTPPTNPAAPAFWIDASPLATNGGSSGSDEINFQISVPQAGTVNVGAVGGNPFTTITSSGWYQFKMTFAPGASGNVENDLSVLDSTGTVLGTSHYVSTLPNADLGGNSYGDWTTVWQNGFAGDTLAIDNVQTGSVPEPAAATVLCLGGVAALRRRRRA